MKIEGASPNPKVSALDELEGRSNYFIGNDPKKWTSDVPLYKKVRFQSVYPGIDLLYYGTQGQLEYDFVIAPHADPEKIKVAFSGAEHMGIDKNGDLQINVGSGHVTFHKPVISQERDGAAIPVNGTFRIRNSREVSFDLGHYDRSRELVIDPSLVYATYLSGSTSDWGQAIAVDNSGYAYITGWTQSTDFPTTPGAYRTINAGIQNVFITKLNATGSALVYSTYLGSSGHDYSYGIALDGDENAYVTGITYSDSATSNFPTTAGAFQQCSGQNQGYYYQGFVTKLNSAGSALVYSTCFTSPNSYIQPQSIAVDSSGSAYITGYNSYGSIPVTPGAFQTSSGGSNDAFVAKFTPDGTGLAYSTYLGGNGNDQGQAISVDTTGNAYVAGTTSSQNFPTTAGAFRANFQGGTSDAFVAKVNATGSALVYSTYLGGSGPDYGYAIAVDGTGAAYVGGNTGSINNFPITPGAYRTNYSGGYLAKLTPDGSGLDYSTYLGNGGGGESANALAIDSSGVSYFLLDSYYIDALSIDGSTLLSSYSNAGNLYGIAVDSSGASYAAGASDYNWGFQTTPGAFQTSPHNVNSNGVALKLAPLSAPVVYLSTTSLNFGSQIVNITSSPVAVTLTNQGESPLAISSIVVSGDYAETNNCGNSLGSNLSCTISITFTPTVVGTRTGSVTITDNNGGAVGSQQTISLTGVGVAPIVSLSTTSLTFGNQAVGTVSAAQNVTLTNIGNATLTISGIVPSGDFAETNNCGGSVVAGGKCTISVTFAPTASGTRTGTIGISDNATDSPQYIFLTGQGVGGSPIATLSTTSLTFGGQAVGTTSSAQSVTLTNTGTVNLTINNIVSSGDYGETNNCPASLAANANCNISVTFTPTVSGTRTGAVTITDNASNSPQTIALTGTGLAPAVSLSATSLTFSSQQVGTISAVQNVTLTNTGNATLTIGSIVAAGDYGETNTCGSSLAAGANCTIAITFAPQALGLRIGSVTITDNASGSPQTISLQGTGVAPFVSLSATTLSFGNQIVSTTSAAQTVTMTNTGTGTLLNISIVTAGDFAQTNNCGSSLGAGLNCTISVTYTPTVLGNESGSVSISDSAAGSPQQITLSGTGVPAIAASPTTLSFTLQLLSTTSATQVVTLTNYQAVAVNVGTISISGPFTETDNCANTQVAAGGTCTISVAFVPTADGVATGTLTISDGGPGSSPTVQLAGTGSGFVPNGFVGVSSMGIPRAQHQATLLTTGNVLITGGASTAEAQLYNPTTTSFTATANNMSTARTWHQSHQIAKGNVLVLGGVDANGNYLASADLYNYKTNTFSPTGSMTTPRALPTGTWLSGQGELLVTGGFNSTGSLGSAELYNAAAGTFSPTTGSMYTQRYNHAAAALLNGTVLITGGRCNQGSGCANDVGISAEIYTPSTGKFTRVGNMNVSRYLHTAITLSDGTVLITGGFFGTVHTAEIYNPTTQTFTPTATEMVGGSVEGHRATPLSLDTGTTNQILITGGYNQAGTVQAEAQLYTVATQTFTAVGSMTIPRSFHTATPVTAGVVIVTGGSDQSCESDLYACPQQWASAETFTLETLATTTTSLASSLNPSTYGQAISFTAKVTAESGTPAGTVQFSIDGSAFGSPVTLASGSATSGSVSTLTEGPHTITAVYSGATNFATSTGTLIGGQAVNPATADTVVTSSLNPSTYGQAVTLTATISGEYGLIRGSSKGQAKPQNVTGTVTWSSNTGCNVSTVASGNPGVATCTTSSLAVGTDAITATYSGDSNHGGSTGTLSGGQVVNRASQTITCSVNAPLTVTSNDKFTMSCIADTPVVYSFAGTLHSAAKCTTSSGTYTVSGAIGKSCTMTINAPAGTDYLAAPTLTETTTIAAKLSLSPASINFGNLTIGETDYAKVTVGNGGTVAVYITGISITGTDPGDFGFSGYSGDCPLTPGYWNPGTSCTMRVWFSPTAPRARTAQISIDDNGPQTINLRGRGTIN
jgi:hypothetical protein